MVSSISYSPDGSKLAAAHYKTVSIFNMETNEVLCTVKAHSGWVRAVAWSPCGQWLASGGDDKMVNVYDAKTFEVKWPLRGHGREVMSVSWSPDGTRLTSGSRDETVRIWEAATGKQLWQLNVDAGDFGSSSSSSSSSCSGGVLSVSFSPKGDMVAAGCYNGNIFFVDAAAGQIKSSVNVGYAFSRFSTRISVRVRPLFSRFSTRISVQNYGKS